jgi:hypothetical protein
MSKEITAQNIYNFIEGNIRLKTKSIQPSHIKEQIAFRLLKCKDDCTKKGKCIACGCDFPDRVYSSESCNPDRFPNFMSGLEWEEFKFKNKINE